MNQNLMALIDFIQSNGLNNYFEYRKNWWKVVSGGYEDELTAYLYHKFACDNEFVYWQTPIATNTGEKIRKQPDMVVVGEAGKIKNKFVLTKTMGPIYTNIPVIALIEVGHDFANRIKGHLNKALNSYKKYESVMHSYECDASLLTVHIATEYKKIPKSFNRYKNSRGRTNPHNNQNYGDEIEKLFREIGILGSPKKTYSIIEDDLEIDVHVIFGYFNSFKTQAISSSLT